MPAVNRSGSDPYNGFTDDSKRCLALNVRAVCRAVAAIATAAIIAAQPWSMTEAMRWLGSLLR